MPFRDPRQAFKDILENIGRIERFTAGLDENSFKENEQTVFAVQYALLVISEATMRQSSFVFSQVQWLDSARAGRKVFTYDIGLAPPFLRDSSGTYPQDAVSCRH